MRCILNEINVAEAEVLCFREFEEVGSGLRLFGTRWCNQRAPSLSSRRREGGDCRAGEFPVNWGFGVWSAWGACARFGGIWTKVREPSNFDDLLDQNLRERDSSFWRKTWHRFATFAARVRNLETTFRMRTTLRSGAGM